MSRNIMLVEDALGNTVSHVYSDDDGNVYVRVQGEGDHPSTRRARARAALKRAGVQLDVGDYQRAVLMTHRNANGDVYGSLHIYYTK